MAVRLSSVKYEVTTISSNVYTNTLSLNTISSGLYSLTTSPSLSLTGDLIVGGNLSVIGTFQSPGTYHCNLTMATTSTLSGSDLTAEFSRSSDPNSWYSTSGNKRVTPTVSGWYSVFYQVKFNAATVVTGAQWNIQLLRNNVTVAIAQSPIVGDVGRTLVTQATLYFNGTTDYLTAQIYASNTTTIATDPGWSRLELFRIG
jgi:hypothetical protein